MKKIYYIIVISHSFCPVTHSGQISLLSSGQFSNSIHSSKILGSNVNQWHISLFLHCFRQLLYDEPYDLLIILPTHWPGSMQVLSWIVVDICVMVDVLIVDVLVVCVEVDVLVVCVVVVVFIVVSGSKHSSGSGSFGPKATLQFVANILE